MPEEDIFARHFTGFWQFSLVESFLLNPQKFGGSGGLRFSTASPIRTGSAFSATQSIVWLPGFYDTILKVIYLSI